MARDAKIIQRGINNTANDLAVPPGTMTDSKNLPFGRDGVAARRLGHESLWAGLPSGPFDVYDPEELGAVRGVYDLFSRNVAFHLNNGMLFAFDEINGANVWRSVPVNVSHLYRFHGSWQTSATSYETYTQIGRRRILIGGSNQDVPMSWQFSETGVSGTIQALPTGTVGNLSSEATAATSVQLAKFKTAFDSLSTTGGAQRLTSDETSIRSVLGAAFAGSITLAGTTDATGSAARFTNATWMAVNGTDVYVVDNGNAIRKITSGAVVTTLAGSVTASGSTDAVGTAARFTNLSGLCYSGGFLYATEGASAHRVRKIDVTTGSVTIFAGSLTATSGYTDAVGTLARFNTPVGIEAIGSNLYVGDTVNNVIRRIVISSASVTTFAGDNTATSLSSGFVPGTLASSIMPSATVRSTYSPLNFGLPIIGSATYLCFECAAPNSSQDTCFVEVPSTVTNLATDQYTYHFVRSPNSLVSTASAPNKADFYGINSYARQDVMAADTVGGAVFTTTEKPRVLDGYTRLNSTDPMPRLRQLGIRAPEAPSCTTATGSTFAANSAWAYRTLCGLKLPNGRIALGPPSERVIVTTTGSVAGSVTAFPAPGLPYDGLPFVQVYRTRTTASSLTDPGDIMFLCYEAALTYGAGIVFTDTLPDDLLGAELYTNQNAYGAASASLPPPGFANEVASFNGQCVVSNFIPDASCRVKVLGVSALVSGTSSVTFTNDATGSLDVSYPFTVFLNSAATDPSINRAQIASSGSAAQNAVQTARNIVRVINRSSDAQSLRAFYDETDPGSFVVVGLHPGVSRTNVAGDNAAKTNIQSNISFSTNASTSFATIALNNSQRQLNAVAPSDQGDIDSFPIINQKTCGPSTEAILRTLPIADTLLVVKDDTIFRSDVSYAFQIYETALSCSLPNSFARLNNQWIGLFNAGFRALTASQAVAVGRPIDRRVQSRYASGSYFGSNDFASAAAVDHQGVYLCAFNKQVFSFSAYGGGAWGAFEMPYADQPSWLGAHGDAFIPVISNYPRGVFRQINQQNSTLLSTLGYRYLFYDAAVVMTAAATITASTSLSATFVSQYSPLGTAPTSYVGAWISSGSVTAEILSGTGAPFTLDREVTIANGASITVYMPIPIMAQYAPTLAPGINSQFCDVGVTIERVMSGSLTTTFYNRKDFLSLANAAIPYGQFGSSNGVTRTNVMGDVDEGYAYYDFQRFATPAERAQDQVLAVAVSNTQALQPLAIKAVTIDYNEGGKVTQ